MDCNRCENELEERQHKFLTEKLVKQPYFFLKWYICPSCGWRIQFETDKIYNKINRKLWDL